MMWCGDNEKIRKIPPFYNAQLTGFSVQKKTIMMMMVEKRESGISFCEWENWENFFFKHAAKRLSTLKSNKL